MDNYLQKIALTKIPKIGPILARNLISYCGSLEAVFQAKKRALTKIPGIGEKTADIILQKDYFREAEAELQFIEDNDIQPLFFLDKGYPNRLNPYDTAPILLYYKGTSNLNHPRIVAIVGTRKPSATSISICEEMVAELKAYNVLVLSGLAYGIDITAHRKSLTLDMETVGVLGHGLARIYPHQHRHIALQMIENGGLLTEFSSNIGPEAAHFPMRNRIVAGMCDALVVVETGKKGGSMITAKLANEYSKDVFAIPGRIKDAHLEGCNHLIKTHQAALIESAADIGYILRWEETSQNSNPQKLMTPLNAEEQRLVDLMKDEDGIEIDQLTIQSKFDPSKVASLLLTMEFKGIVKPLPGKRYILI